MTSSDIIWHMIKSKAREYYSAPATNGQLIRDTMIELETLCEAYARIEHPGDLIPEFRAMYRAQALNYAEQMQERIA
jgi:hypothetical protein